MKYKNYKSTIHNFTHSFISVDYMKSGKLAVNVLIDLHNLGLEVKATFDFINKTIIPDEANSEQSRQLMDDYLDWLPEHFKNHNSDLSKVEKLEITLWTDFNNTLPYERNQKDRVFKVSALAKWKSEGGKDEKTEITQSQVIPKELVELKKIPRITEME